MVTKQLDVTAQDTADETVILNSFYLLFLESMMKLVSRMNILLRSFFILCEVAGNAHFSLSLSWYTLPLLLSIPLRVYTSVLHMHTRMHPPAGPAWPGAIRFAVKQIALTFRRGLSNCWIDLAALRSPLLRRAFKVMYYLV